MIVIIIKALTTMGRKMNKLIKIASAIVILIVIAVVGGVIAISSMDFNQYKGIIAEQAKAATGRDLVIEGDLNIELSLTPRIAVNGVTFANASWGSKPNMVKVKRFAAEIQIISLLSKQIKINQIILEGVELLAEKNKAGKANWEFSATASKSADKSSAGGETILPVVNNVHLKDIQIVYNDAQAGQNYNLNLASVDLKSDGLDAPLELLVKGAINNQTFSVGGQLGSIRAIMGGGMIPIKLNIEALKTKIGLDGNVGMPGGKAKANLNLAVDGASLAKTLDAAVVLAPELKNVELPIKGVFKISSTVKLDGPTKIALDDLSAAIGPLAMTGSLDVNLGGVRPEIKAMIKTDTLNLDQLLPKKAAKAEPAKKSEPGDGRVFPNDPLPLAGLKAADANVKFDATKIIVDGMEINDVTVTLSLKNGRLSIDPLGAIVAGGKINGQVQLDTSKKTPSLKTKIIVKQLDYGILLAQRGMDKIASGKADVLIDVFGSGSSVRQLMAGLGGIVRIVTENGKLESNALNNVSADIGNFLNSKDDKKIRCGVVHFNIINGLAKVHALVFETGGISIIGVGSTNLADESLKLRVDPRSKKTNLATVAMVPVNIKGTYSKPDWEIDKMAAAGNVAAGAARIGGAIASGGLSLLFEKAAKETVMKTDKTDYCLPALAGKKVVLGKMAEAKKSSKPPATQPTKQENSGPVGGITKGISSGLKSLFGK
jgi:uncharacterized protein involved in outer membrane biogenesis